MKLIATQYKTQPNGNLVGSYTVHTQGCTFKLNNQPYNVIPYNIEQITLSTSANYNRFIVFTHNQDVEQSGQICNADKGNMYLFYYNNYMKEFVMVKTWTNILTQSVINKINVNSVNNSIRCSNCDYLHTFCLNRQT